MAKRVRLAAVESLERKQAELAAQLKAARKRDREREREEEARRAALIGMAVVADTPADDLAKIIRGLIPKHVKAKADLVLFKQWLTTAQIAAGEGDEHRPDERPATETG